MTDEEWRRWEDNHALERQRLVRDWRRSEERWARVRAFFARLLGRNPN